MLKVYLQIHFFSEKDGLPSKIVEALNYKLAVVLIECNRAVTELTLQNRTLKDKIKSLVKFSATQIEVSNMPLQVVLKAVSINIGKPEILWDEIAEVFGTKYFNSIISEEYGIDLNNVDTNAWMDAID
jgi:hypothetical protein